MSAEWGGRERALALSAAVLLAMAAMLGRAAHLQIIQGGQYRMLSNQNRVRMTNIPSPRGRVIDRNGTVIAESRPGYALVLFGTSNWRPAVRTAARLLGLDSMAAEATIRQQRSAYPKDPVKLVRDLSPVQVAVLEEHLDSLPGLRLEYEALRQSNYGQYGSHLLGYVSEIGKKELEKRRQQGYRFGDVIGKAGLERQYENMLRGADGCEYVEVDAHGRVQGSITQMPEQLPVPGVDIVLTVDWRLQVFLEGLFEPGLTGAAVALEPGTGRILALVSRPNFEPKLFAGGISADH
jgi:penicillin-binding protein 2